MYLGLGKLLVLRTANRITPKRRTTVQGEVKLPAILQILENTAGELIDFMLQRPERHLRFRPEEVNFDVRKRVWGPCDPLEGCLLNEETEVGEVGEVG